MNKIVLTLKKYPYKSIMAVARDLGVEVFEVSQAQHEHVKPYIPRKNKNWDERGYGKH